MTDVQDANSNVEPSMEEILASIRRIIADEKDAPAQDVAEEADPKDDILELTQVVESEGLVASANEPQVIAAAPEPPPVKETKIEKPAQPVKKEEADALLSNIAATATVSSLEALAQTVEAERKVTSAGTPLGGMGKTLEDMVMELMKPMLKEWLDQNLPSLVERIVQKEVERIARRVQE